MKWQEFIVSDPSILLGKPIIKGTRISVEIILDLLDNGWTPQQLIEAYPSLTPDSISAVFSYLKECISHEFYFPFSA